MGVLLWTTVDYWGDSWGHLGSWGLLGVSGWPLRVYRGFLVATGSYLGLLWTIGGLLWTTGVTPGDIWGSWGLLGVPGWPLRGYCGFLGTTGCYLGLLWTIGYYCGLLWTTWVYLGLLGST